VSENYIHRYAEPLPGGRAIMRVDIVHDGVLVDSHLEGSPASWATVKAHEEMIEMRSPTVNPLDVRCPRCGARPGERCARTSPTEFPPRGVHQERMRAFLDHKERS